MKIQVLISRYLHPLAPEGNSENTVKGYGMRDTKKRCEVVVFRLRGHREVASVRRIAL